MSDLAERARAWWDDVARGLEDIDSLDLANRHVINRATALLHAVAAEAEARGREEEREACAALLRHQAESIARAYSNLTDALREMGRVRIEALIEAETAIRRRTTSTGTETKGER